MTSPTEWWQLHYETYQDPQLELALAERVGEIMPWLDVDRQWEIGVKAAGALTCLYASAEAGFTQGIDAVLDFEGYQVVVTLPDLSLYT